MNFFEYYNLPITFSIDKKALRKAYLEKSREVHPDIVDQNSTEDLSAFNNEAYTTLNDDMLLLKYVLTLYEVPLDSKNAPMPQDFLMDMMDINEEIMEAKMDGVIGSTLIEKVKIIESNIMKEYNHVIENFDHSSSTNLIQTSLLTIRDYFLKLNYLKRLNKNLNSNNEM